MTILCTLEELKTTASRGPVLKGKKITSLYRDGAIALAPDGVPQHPGQPFDTQQES